MLYTVWHIHSLTFNWILLAGFPRTRHQAEALSNAASINVAINLIVPDDVIVARIAGRWVHVPSGRVYHTEFNPPRVPVSPLIANW
jgi:adenylate kinase family enzyme